MKKVKFMQVLDPRILNILKRAAKVKGVSVQELIRVSVVPEWLLLEKAREANRKSFKTPNHRRK